MNNHCNNTKLLIITEFPDSYNEIYKKYSYEDVKLFDVSSFSNDKRRDTKNIISSIKQQFPEMRCDNILLDLHGNLKADETHVFGSFGESGFLIEKLQGVFKANNFIITSCHCGKKSMSKSLEKYKIYGNIIHFGSTKNLLLGNLIKDDVEAIIDFLCKKDNTKYIEIEDIKDICQAIYTIHIHRLGNISTFNKYDKIKYFGNMHDKKSIKENYQENSQERNEENNQESCEQHNLPFNILTAIFRLVINIIKFICNIFILFAELIFNIIFDSEVDFNKKKEGQEISIDTKTNRLGNKHYQDSGKLLLRYILEGKFELVSALINKKQDLKKNFCYEHLHFAVLSNNIKMLDDVVILFSEKECAKHLQKLFADIFVNITEIDIIKEEMIDKVLSIKDRLGIIINLSDTSVIHNTNNISIQKKLQKILANINGNHVNHTIHIPSNDYVKGGNSITDHNSHII